MVNFNHCRPLGICGQEEGDIMERQLFFLILVFGAAYVVLDEIKGRGVVSGFFSAAFKEL